MTTLRNRLSTLLLIAVLLPHGLYACTTFCLDNGDDAPVFGRNYDWMVGDGLVMVNKSGVDKIAAFVEAPAVWTSEYGSVTFNQYGRELPCGGMNEAGLVVEVMWLSETVYPPPDERSAISELQWVQYQLDNYSTVTEVLASDEKIRIDEGSKPLHFLVCDASGDCAAIEFLGGEMVAHFGDDLPYSALANSTYDDSIAYAEGYLVGCGELPVGDGSLERFTRACDLSTRFNGDTPVPAVDYSFTILDNVAQKDGSTVWSIVYDYDDSHIYFKTDEVTEIRYFDTSAFDYSNETQVKIVDMNAEFFGDVTKEFVDYTYEANRELIGVVFSSVDFLKDVPEEALDAIAHYPEDMGGE
ncbi:MAG: linear amide C-N hydrolase [bacterium]|nr:linear amide C-N hydrolase [bacterium]